MRHHLEFEQWVPYPLRDVFDFFADPDNLPPLMPEWQAARIDRRTLTAPPEPPEPRVPGQAAGVGSRMLISFRAFPFLPVRMRWDARITEFAWDDHFCDEQLSGPFAYWRHCHHVRREARAGVQGTLVKDAVTYAFPLGPLGDVANVLGGALQMRALFHYRQKQLTKLLPRWVAGGG